MVQNVVLVTIGLLLGVMITMMMQSSMVVSHLQKLRKAEFEIAKLKHKNADLFDKNTELAAENAELKQVLKANGIPDYENW